ncbi:FapA family protein [Pelosinus sp. IPA-1]|uniref:DUF342 domain-containing protein n=1 Tax=Pelosinus sp. IPA-1 TaxID=3029569 RepID=UPI0024362A0E|nr:FapA family protein [Pelosinus sp. IPA-1]GMB02207.1 polymerase [Pelosinus sp. IPA-1]
MNEKVSPLKEDGRYQITATDTGVCLSVWPPGNNGMPVKKATIIQDLTNRNFINYDSNFISIVIKEAIGKPIQIFSSLPSEDGRYQITATDTGVYLSVWSPVNMGSPVKKTEIIQDLINQKFTNFDSDFISTVIREAIGRPILIMNSLPSQDGRYQITATDAGVHLSVWSPVNTGLPVKKADIIQELMKQKFTDFDSDFISTVIKEAIGQPVLIVNALASIQMEPNIRVRVRRDRLEARIDLTIPEDVSNVTMSQLIDKLKSAGVVYGIDVSALESLTQLRAGSDIVVARGKTSCNGNDAFLHYHVDSDSQGRPVEMDDGRVDFKENNSFLCVEEGQLLVEKIPATPGTSGIDVFGLPILAKPGKDILMPVGKNVVNVDDWRLYAAIDGHLHIFLDKRINVIEVIVIDGDVDYSSGNIEFRGSVIVRGSVQPEFSVKAGGNVEICGSICGGIVEANNIIIHRGIQGMNRSVIKARERLRTNFIENATVYADQEVHVSDVILNSSVFAGVKVIVEGQRGLVRGGRISAGEEIRALTIGNQANVATDIEVSVNPYLKDELFKIRLESKKAMALYEELKKSLSYILSQGVENLSAEKRDRYAKKEAECNTMRVSLDEMRQRIAHIEDLLKSLKPGKIHVNGVIYPGVKLFMGPLTKPLNDPLKYVSLYVHDGEIKFTSLR